MFVNELFFSLFLLSFAALLCLFGVVMLIDGIIRLTGQWRRRAREEKPTAEKQAA